MVREGYLELLKRFPERIRKVDAHQTLENVFKDVMDLINAML